MKKFVLHGEMADLFTSEIYLDVQSANEAMYALSVNFPSLKPYIIKKALAGINYEFVDTRNVNYESCFGSVVLKDTEYHIMPIPEGRGGLMGGLGAFMGTPAGAFLGNFALGYGMEKITEKLMENTIQSDDVTEYEIITTNSHIYTQNENKTEQGSPVPIVYGQLRVGSKILNSSVENYDYNYEDAEIYRFPEQLRNINKIKDGQFSFVTPLDDVKHDYRAAGSDESLENYKLEDKRVLTFDGENSSKGEMKDGDIVENEASNANYESDSWSAKKVSHGPSKSPDRPTVPDGGETSVAAGSNSPRPYVFPDDNTKDGSMRPQSSRDLCVEVVSIDGQEPQEQISLAYINPQRAMTVGDRGSYQKLESIGIYKSLEIISEGPIAGLAHPIDGFNRDNGIVSWPLGAEDESNNSNRIVLGPLKYIASNNHLGDKDNSSANITVIASGKDYTSIAKTISVKADGYIRNSEGISIRSSRPSTVATADIDYASFVTEVEVNTVGDSASSDPDQYWYVSSNRIFQIDPDDGTLFLNTNTNDAPGEPGLSNTYRTQLDGNDAINLAALSQDTNRIGQFGQEDRMLIFNDGEGYPELSTNSVSLHPAEKVVEFEPKITKGTFNDAVSQARCFDLGTAIGVGTTLADLSTSTVNMVESSFEEKYLGQDWDQMCRIFAKQKFPTNPESAQYTKYIPVGFATRKDGQAANRVRHYQDHKGDRLLSFHFSEYIKFVEDDEVLYAGNAVGDNRTIELYLRLTLGDYIGLKEMPDWNDWENWLYYDTQTYTYNSILEYEHTKTEEIPSENEFPWSSTITYNQGSFVSYQGKTFEAKRSIAGEINPNSIPEWNQYTRYSTNPNSQLNKVNYNGKQYQVVATGDNNSSILLQNPNITSVPQWEYDESYNIERQVYYGEKYWEAIQPSQGKDNIAAAVDWSANKDFSIGNIVEFQNEYYKADAHIDADLSNTAPTGTGIDNPWIDAEYNDPPSLTNPYWEHVPYTSPGVKNPTYQASLGEDGLWEEITYQSPRPISPDSVWNRYDSYQIGDFVEYRNYNGSNTVFEVYRCTQNIAAQREINGVEDWRPEGILSHEDCLANIPQDYDPQVDGFTYESTLCFYYLTGSRVKFLDTNGQLKVFQAKRDIPVVFDLSAGLNDPVNKYRDEAGQLSNSIDDHFPQMSDWEEVEYNEPPDIATDQWQVSPDWKLATRSISTFFDKEEYSVYCHFEWRMGISQFKDVDEDGGGGGFLASVGNFFGGGAPKYPWCQWMGSRGPRAISTNWRNLKNGRFSNVTVADMLKEYFKKETVVYKKVEDGGAFSSDDVSELDIENAVTYYRWGEDFNRAILQAFTNGTYSESGDLQIAGGSLALTSKDKVVSNKWNNRFQIGSARLSHSSSLLADLKSNEYKSVQIRHFEFTIGVGGKSNYDIFQANSSTLSSLEYSASFPIYMNQTLGQDYVASFNNLLLVDTGVNPKDDSDCPYGFYDPELWPRVTIYIVRRRNFSISLMPTNIEAVAKVNSFNNSIDRLYLLKVPERPVWDNVVNRWTNIHPQASANIPHYFDGANYQDYGVHIKVDKTNGYEYMSFAVDSDTSIVSNSKNFSIYGGWESFIKEKGMFELDGPVNTRHGTAIDIIDENGYHNPTTYARGTIVGESINGSNYAGYDSASFRSATSNQDVYTGRIKSISLTATGQGYNKNREVNQILQRQFYTLRGLSTNLKEQGYKPFEQFYVYGLPRSIYESGIFSVRDVTVKIRLAANHYGVFDANYSEATPSIVIVDGGYGFYGENDDIVFLSKDYMERLEPGGNWNSLTSLKNSFNVHLATRCGSNSIDNNSDLLDPAIQYPKTSAIINFSVVNGSVSAFYVSQEGKGFNAFSTIQNPFDSNSFVPPTINLNFDSSGHLISAQVDRNEPVAGYSVFDDYINLVVSGPQSSNSSTPNSIQNDSYARFRSIYLNDVPIRDHNGRFNYSKFHFDMRIGHYKNGSGTEHNLNAPIAPEADTSLMSPEFQIPTHTKFINYPLFGPRNSGEKDYFYSHTVKNPEVSDISFSINIKQLHYIYEGDSSTVYLNLIPIIGAILGWMVGKAAAEQLADEFWPNPATTFGLGASTGFSFPGVNIAKKLVSNVKRYALVIGGGVLGAIGMWNLLKGFKCSKVPWLCITIGDTIKNSGEIWPAKVSIAIEYGIEGEELTTNTFTFRGCATNSYVKDIFINNLPSAESTSSDLKKNRIFRVYRLTRELDPVTGGLVEARYKINADLLSITEYVGGMFSYPNSAIVGTRFNAKDSPSVPRREYLIKGAMVKVPSNYFPSAPSDKSGKSKFQIESERYDSESWDGTFSEELKWTSNPAWIIFDLLTNQRYGMGKYGIKPEDVDKWSFYKFAKRCDEEVDVIIEGKQTTERRHMCNIYIDSERQAYEYIKDLMRIYDATISFTAGSIHISQDAPSETGPVMLFNNSNVEENGFSYSSTPETSRITAVTVDFIDERDNYMQKTEYVEDAEGVREHGYKHAKIAGIGITRRGEAHRLAWHKILSRQLEKEIISFKTGFHGSYLRINDVIEVIDNNKISHHSGGRIIKIKSSNTIEIDIPTDAIYHTNSLYIQVASQAAEAWSSSASYSLDDIVFDSSGEYFKLTEVIVNDPPHTEPSEDSDHWTRIDIVREKQFKEYSISSMNGFEVVLGNESNGSSPDLLNDAIDGAVWMIKGGVGGDLGVIAPRQYRVKEIKEISSLQYEVLGVEYIDEKYEHIDNSTGSQKGIELESRVYTGHPISTS